MLRKQSFSLAILEATARPAFVCAFAALAFSTGVPRASAADDLLHTLSSVTDAMLAKPPAADWLMRRGNFASWGFSTLDQINTGNVGGLRLAWAWNMELGYQEEAPLAHEGVLFLAQPRNVVQALDGRTGDLLWEYRRELPKVEGGYHNDLFSRARGTIALHDDKVFLATADAHIVASTRTLVK
jgi:alcohol dehydrogenase (cytochrome c)